MSPIATAEIATIFGANTVLPKAHCFEKRVPDIGGKHGNAPFRVMALVLLALAIPTASPAQADDYPNKPVRIISDSATGSAVDVTFRIVMRIFLSCCRAISFRSPRSLISRCSSARAPRPKQHPNQISFAATGIGRRSGAIRRTPSVSVPGPPW
jgi:hypothetical protein